MNVNCESRDNWYIATVDSILKEGAHDVQYTLGGLKDLIAFHSELATGLQRDWRTIAVLLESLGHMSIIRTKEQATHLAMFTGEDQFVIHPRLEIIVHASAPLEVGTPVIDHVTGALALVTDWVVLDPEIRYSVRSIKGETTNVKREDITNLELGPDSNAAIAIKKAVGL